MVVCVMVAMLVLWRVLFTGFVSFSWASPLIPQTFSCKAPVQGGLKNKNATSGAELQRLFPHLCRVPHYGCTVYYVPFV